jgi:hypothetical protein
LAKSCRQIKEAEGWHAHPKETNACCLGVIFLFFLSHFLFLSVFISDLLFFLKAPLVLEHASSSSATPYVEKPASPRHLDIPAMSPVSSQARASSPAADKTATPVRNSPPPEHTTSAPDVDMDMGAHQNAPDTGADTSCTGTEDNASASDKSANTDKGKALE